MTKSGRGEGFTIRFTRRPFLGRKNGGGDAAENVPAKADTNEAAEAVPARLKDALSDLENKLREAAKIGDCHAIRLLVLQGTDLESRDGQGRTAFNIATQYNQQAALKTLLAAREMRYLASLGDLPDTEFFRKFGARARADH